MQRKPTENYTLGARQLLCTTTEQEGPWRRMIWDNPMRSTKGHSWLTRLLPYIPSPKTAESFRYLSFGPIPLRPTEIKCMRSDTASEADGEFEYTILLEVAEDSEADNLLRPLIHRFLHHFATSLLALQPLAGARTKPKCSLPYRLGVDREGAGTLQLWMKNVHPQVFHALSEAKIAAQTTGHGVDATIGFMLRISYASLNMQEGCEDQEPTPDNTYVSMHFSAGFPQRLSFMARAPSAGARMPDESRLKALAELCTSYPPRKRVCKEEENDSKDDH